MGEERTTKRGREEKKKGGTSNRKSRVKSQWSQHTRDSHSQTGPALRKRPSFNICMYALELRQGPTLCACVARDTT